MFDDDAYETRMKREDNETVAKSFVRGYSANPLDLLIRKEESKLLRGFVIDLQDFLRQSLDPPDYAFLLDTLGKQWKTNWKLPLEFRDFTPYEFEEFLTDRLGIFKERISILREYCGGATLKNRMPVS